MAANHMVNEGEHTVLNIKFHNTNGMNHTVSIGKHQSNYLFNGLFWCKSLESCVGIAAIFLIQIVL